MPVSSRKSQAGTRRGDEGRARETRRCLRADADGAETTVDDDGNGAVKEKVDDEGVGMAVLSELSSSSLDIKTGFAVEGDHVAGCWTTRTGVRTLRLGSRLLYSVDH